jgi:neutral ceramidase
MMGYGKGNQSTSGIHIRQRARVMVVEDKRTLEKIAYVNLDVCFSSMLVKTRVLDILNKVSIASRGLLNSKTLPFQYTLQNVLITSTHTHSGPGGFSWYTLYDITSLGWHESNVNTIVSGIVNAILTAHKSKGLY